MGQAELMRKGRSTTSPTLALTIISTEPLHKTIEKRIKQHDKIIFHIRNKNTSLGGASRESAEGGGPS